MAFCSNFDRCNEPKVVGCYYDVVLIMSYHRSISVSGHSKQAMHS